jgi:hypothetical protein
MTTNFLGQNFISNTDWMIKRDLVNLKHEINQMKRELSETLERIAPSPKGSSSGGEDSLTMVNRMKSEERNQSIPKSVTPLSLDAIRQSNLQNRDTYFLSQSNGTPNGERGRGNDMNNEGTSLQSNDDQLQGASTSVTLSSGLSIPSVRLDKTNILLLGPTGRCPIIHHSDSTSLSIILSLLPYLQCSNNLPCLTSLPSRRIWKNTNCEIFIRND